ncbi:nad dependent epimerase dehydratase family protein [Colletotrichum karsti]|uniref:Nad dependent epimerase dehydratase family protein n=1 Tax=Colletotrichum karsti TaxID=1095194 RepID=A0A9P6LN61_9PEZI|nr:nad dependent epimerase dehydratase family protein [Colletotrichum karsti]KAF9878881.1 nad dependent epimerase dehydratase family protein [Colletotrichum karsti]
MSSRHVLILGGHGKVSQYLTPILLNKSWTVTSVIRAQEQVPTIEKLGAGSAGKLNVLVRSVEDVRDQAQAQAILDEVKPDTVIWSAGAGGKGDPQRTFTVDRDAAIHFVKASVATPSVKKFILVSYLASRKNKPTWWSDDEWQGALDVNKKLSNYFKAKVAADEVLWEESRTRPDFAGVSLRPGTLSDEPAGKVEFGKTKGSRGTSSRQSVAEVAALIAEQEGFKTSWVDHLDGQEDPKEAVARVAREGVDVAEGEAFYKA